MASNGEFPNVNSLTSNQIIRYINLIERKLNVLNTEIEKLEQAPNLRNITKQLNESINEYNKYINYYNELIKKYPKTSNSTNENDNNSNFSSSNNLSLPNTTSKSSTLNGTNNEYGYEPLKIPTINNDPHIPSFGGKRRHKRSAKWLRSARKRTRRTRRQKH